MYRVGWRLTDFLTRCVYPAAEDRSTATELLQSTFIQHALCTGMVDKQDARLAGFVKELNCSSLHPELRELVEVINAERFVISFSYTFT